MKQLSLIIVLSIVSLSAFTFETSNGSTDQESVTKNSLSTFDELWVLEINRELQENYLGYQLSPNTYWTFLNSVFLSNWDFGATASALLGKDIYSQMSEDRKERFIDTITITFIRYAYEFLAIYDGHQFTVLDSKMDDARNFKWLKIGIESTKFPNISLDVLLKRNPDKKWRGVDFSFKGISFIALKKHSYRQNFEEFLFFGMLNELKHKNRVFFSELCDGKFNETNSKMPPCLQINDKK